MVNYQNGKIYMLFSAETDKVYIGSTTKRLCDRKHDHKSCYRLYNEGRRKHRVSAFEIIKYDDCQIRLLKNFPCNSKETLLAKEQVFIDKYANRCVNIARAKLLTPEEKAQNKLLNDPKNKALLKARDKKRLATPLNCPCGGSSSIKDKARHMRSVRHLKYIDNFLIPHWMYN